MTKQARPANRELDRALALGWTKPELLKKIANDERLAPPEDEWAWQVPPSYSSDLNVMREVEAEIGRRDLHEAYIDALLRECRLCVGTINYRVIGWLCARATAEQRARAALAVLSAKE